ncbi:hypothetical protein TRICI_006714 [Trichomonascus ciferrii]|uniref:Uncharacterized protein n=1 Tax=Trichomonascus ciferrii TaxID=44093 RepID=A0A642UEE4_9ASCO|nr:hypothetical protein TRICI_006714 [Trichomonascus ciferrii]
MKKIDSSEKIVSASLRVTGWNGNFMTFGSKYYNIFLFVDASQDLPKFQIAPGTTLSIAVKCDSKIRAVDPHQLPSTLFRDFLLGIDCPSIPKFLNLSFERIVLSRTFNALGTYLDCLTADSLHLDCCELGQWSEERIQVFTPRLDLTYTILAAATTVFAFSGLEFINIEPWKKSSANEEQFKYLLRTNPAINEIRFASFEFDAFVLAYLKEHPNLQTLKVIYIAPFRMMVRFDEILKDAFIELKLTCPKLDTLEVKLLDHKGNGIFKLYTLDYF